jgi:hypothetical protein
MAELVTALNAISWPGALVAVAGLAVVGLLIYMVFK